MPMAIAEERYAAALPAILFYFIPSNILRRASGRPLRLAAISRSGLAMGFKYRLFLDDGGAVLLRPL